MLSLIVLVIVVVLVLVIVVVIVFVLVLVRFVTVCSRLFPLVRFSRNDPPRGSVIQRERKQRLRDGRRKFNRPAIAQPQEACYTAMVRSKEASP